MPSFYAAFKGLAVTILLIVKVILGAVDIAD